MIVSDKDISELLREVGAWQTGHFQLSSGLHSNQYVQCQRILQFPRYGKILAEAMAKRVRAASLAPDVVIGPAMGAIHWELYLASSLDSYQEDPVKAIFAERKADSDDFEIRRGININKGEKVLVVEDVTTTGGSAKKVIDLVRSLGGDVVGVCAILDRSAGAAQFDVPFFPLLKVDMNTHQPETCPMCQEKVPIDKPGSSHKK